MIFRHEHNKRLVKVVVQSWNFFMLVKSHEHDIFPFLSRCFGGVWLLHFGFSRGCLVCIREKLVTTNSPWGNSHC